MLVILLISPLTLPCFRRARCYFIRHAGYYFAGHYFDDAYLLIT